MSSFDGSSACVPATSLLQCQLYRDRCIEEGKMARSPFGGDGSGKETIAVEQAIAGSNRPGTTFAVSAAPIVPSEENELASILAQAVGDCAVELLPGHSFRAKVDGRFVQVELQMPEHKSERILIGICNKTPQGGWLGRQVEDLLRRAVEQTPVAVRSTAYPTNPKAAVTRLLHDLEEGGGRRVVVEDSDWRTMLIWCSSTSSKPVAGLRGLATTHAAVNGPRLAAVDPQSGPGRNRRQVLTATFCARS